MFWLSFDFATAFPALAVAWLKLCLLHFGAPIGFRNFVDALYHDLVFNLQYRGTISFLCHVLRGVIQGCPMASLLFLVGSEPFA